MSNDMPEEIYALSGRSDTFDCVYDTYQWSDQRGTKYIRADLVKQQDVNAELLEALKAVIESPQVRSDLHPERLKMAKQAISHSEQKQTEE